MVAYEYNVRRIHVDGEDIGQTWKPFTYRGGERVIAALSTEFSEETGRETFITVLTEKTV